MDDVENIEKTLKDHGYSPKAIREILNWYVS